MLLLVPPPPPACFWAFLAQACLSIFVTGAKFDVSYFQLTATEPCMNELVIYTKCLIKSAAAPGINIAASGDVRWEIAGLLTPKDAYVYIILVWV